MKKVKLFIYLVLALFATSLHAQTITFSEDFETTPLGVVSSSTGSNAWTLNTNLFALGAKSDSCVVTAGDSTILTTNAFSTTNNTFVMLEFDHICKIEYMDAATIEVSADNGSTWVKLTSPSYLGSGYFGNNGNKFSSTSYVVDWDAANANTSPTNSWWKHESFDISFIATNASQVKVRFVLADGAAANGAGGNAGWFLDNIKVTKALSELQAPTITYIAPQLSDSVYNTGPFIIQANITDVSGIDTALLIYSLNGGLEDTIGMTQAGSLFQGIIDTIPSFSVNDTICYRVFAQDASVSYNSTSNPTTGCNQFVIYNSSPPPACTTPITTFPIIQDFESGSAGTGVPSSPGTLPSGWTRTPSSGSSAYMHLVKIGSTTSTNTGPSGDHTSGSGKYIYGEASYGSTGASAYAQSPCMDITGLSVPQLEFWYHMYGANIGSLTIQMWYGNQWIDIWTKSGGQGNLWKKAIINLTSYKCITQFRFKTTKGGTYGDIAVDDIKIWQPPANDAGVISLDKPYSPAISGTLAVKVSIKNFGSANLTSTTINWEVNGVSQTPYLWTGTLPPMTTLDSVQIGTYAFTAGAPSLKFWTSIPNGVSDGFTYNDTLNTSIIVCDGFLSGSYTVGTSTSDFANIGAAVTALNNCGIDSSVVFNVAASTYTGQLVFLPIIGSSATNTITFKGQGASTIIQRATTTSNRDVIRFNGAKHIILDSLSIQVIGSPTYASGIRVRSNSDSNTVRNCIINVPVSSASYVHGIVFSNSLTSYSTASNSAYWTIENNIITGGYRGIILYGSSANYPKSNKIIGNEIKSFYYYGIYSYYQDGIIISDNNIHDNTYTYGYGLYIYRNKNGVRIDKNRIKLSTASSEYGIYIYYMNYSLPNADTCIVANNMISLTTSTSSIYGIYSYQANRVKIVYNSINITGTSSSTRCLYQSGGSGLVIKNNILSNIGSGYAYYVATPSAIVESDYNDMYSTGAYIGYWGGNKTSLAAMQSASSMDSNSISVNPQFISNTDLHTGVVALFQAADPIFGIIDDYDGDLRDTINSCIGADEFTVAAIDAGISNLISPLSTCAGATENIIVEVKNYGVDTLFNCTINWKIDGISKTAYSFTDTLLYGQTADATIGTHAFSSGASHTMDFWTSLPNNSADGQNSNDSLAIANFQVGLVAGTYTIGGATADYLTIADATNDLSLRGICGPVVFTIASGTYTEQVELVNVQGVSSINTITFKSTAGDSSAVIITYTSSTTNNYVVKLDGTSFIKFQDITFQSTSNATSRVIDLRNGSSDFEFSHCVFKNTVQYTGTTGSSARELVHTSDSVGNNINFNNSLFEYGSIAINLVGSSQHSTGWTVENNRFIENAHVSISFTYAESALAESNYFFLTNGIIRSYASVSINYSTGSCIVSKNIMNIGATAAAHAIRFNFSDGDILNPHLIVNNFIHFKQLNQSHWGCAINMFSATYVNIYHNSVSVTGTYTNTSSFQIYDGNPGSTPSSNIDLKNNIFTNSIPGAKLFRFTPVVYSKFTNDYNILYSYGVGTVSPQISGFAAWKTATGGGANSDTLAPFYTSATDLHVNTNQLNETGVHIDGIIEDIDGDIRDTLLPDIGADEFIPSPFDPGVIALLNPVSACGLDSNETVSILIKNYGSVAVNGGFTVGYNWTGLANPVIESLTDTIQPGDTLLHVFSTPANLDVSSIGSDVVFDIKAWVKYPADNFNANDTLAVNINSKFLPALPITSNVISNYGTTASLSATSPNLIWWYVSDTATVPVFVGTIFQTPILYDTTQYWLSAHTNTCVGPQATAFVNVVGHPSVDAGISNIVWPINSVVSNTTEILKVELHNFGTAALTAVEVHWTINGQHDSINWAGSLAPMSVGTINIDTTTFPGGVYNFVSWTSAPNNVSDTINTNDTSAVSTFNACLSGIYTIGDTTGGAIYDYPSFNAAKNAIIAAGICGNVTFRVDSGIYEERLFLPIISGAGPNARITFTSMSGDSTDVELHYTLSSTAAWTMKFVGNYYTFSHMTLSSNGGSTFGRVMELANGAKYNEILNCVVEGVGTNSSSTNYAVIYSSGGSNEYNTFKNNHILFGAYPLYLYGSSSDPQMGNVIEGNRITGFYYYGPYMYYQKNLQFNDNYIENGNTASVYGARFYYSDNITVTKNIINIHGTSSHYGMYVYYCDGSSSNPNIIANNFVIANGSGTSTWYAVYCYNSTHTKFYNNSINMTGGSTSARAFYQSSGNNITFINNVVSNTGGGYAYYVNTPSAVVASDYNDFYATGSNLAFWNGNRPTFASLKLASGKDSHSKNSDPMFYSPTDLHSGSIDLNNTGLHLSDITVDIDGELRSLTNPDIGADEFTPPPNDAGIYYVNAPLSPVTVGSNNVHVSLRNFGADTLLSATIAWSVNNIAQTPYPWSGALPTGTTANSINIGSYNFTGGTNYLKAWSTSPNNSSDGNNLNDTVMVTLIGCVSPMHGNYTVGGASADFMSIGDAVMQLSTCGIDSHVVININPGTYTEQIMLAPIQGAADTATITFQSSTLDSTDVTIIYNASASNNYTVYFNGADWIRFVNLTIEASNITSGRAVFINNGATHNVFHGNIIRGAASTVSTSAAIYSDGGIDSYNTFTHNDILNGYYGIFMRGGSTTGLENGLVFKYNNVQGYYYYGAEFYYTNNVEIAYNKIRNGSNSNYGYGLYLYYSDGAIQVYNNVIDARPGNYHYGLRLYYCDATANNHGKIYNNFIGITSGSGSNYGLYLYNSKYQDFTNNNILIKGVSTYSRAVYVTSGSNNRLMNNNFIMDGSGYAYYVASPTALTSSDNNNIYSTGGQFAYWSGAKANLSALQTASGKDANSISVNPGYFSDYDLHVTTVNLNANASPLSWVTTDIDGQLRDTLTPDIGADEFTPQANDAAVILFHSPAINYAVQGAVSPVIVKLKNFGMDTIFTMGISYTYGNSTAINETWNGALAPGDTISHIFATSITTMVGSNPLCAYTSLVADSNLYNDTLCINYGGITVAVPTFCDNFDIAPSLWVTDDSEWQMGIPQGANINTAHSAPNVWMTKLSSNYSSSANSNLLSPFIDFTNASGATLKFWYNSNLLANDGVSLQYSTDGGNTWIVLGFMGDPLATNWYTIQIGGVHYWTGQTSSWVQASYDLSQFDNSTSLIQFRFHFFTNVSGAADGFAIDDFCIELPPIPKDAGVISIDAPVNSTVIGSIGNTVTITVKNFGTDTLTTIPVNYEINLTGTVTENLVVAGGLLPDSTASFTFTTTFQGPNADYSLCAFTNLTYDTYTQNDSSCIALSASAAPYDAAAVMVTVSPLWAPDTTKMSYDTQVTLRIRNLGLQSISALPVQFSIGTTVISNETYGGTILSGDSVDYTFATTYHCPVGYYLLCAKVLLVNDANSSNNQTCETYLGMNDVGIDGSTGDVFSVDQNQPNPAFGTVNINYYVPQSGKVKFDLRNVLGQMIQSEEYDVSAGNQLIQLDANKIAEGVYYYTVEFDGQRITYKMIVNR